MRGHRAEDLDASAAMWGDPIVVRYIGGRPSTREEAWSRVLRYAGHWCLLGFGYWAMEEKASGRFVGEVGFADFKRDITPSFEGTPESGWALAPWAHGKGYATEALGAALAWGDSNFPSKGTVCLIDEGNEASVRVATKCGYAESARTTYKGASGVVFRR
jgi:RimJ/RimL family protein N-acetyltransferase